MEDNVAPNEMTCARIHTALHDRNIKTIDIDGTPLVILTYRNGCRYVDYGQIRFMVQNEAKSSVYADEARKGAKITWGQRPGKNWIYIKQALLSDSVDIYMHGPQKEL